VFENRRLCKVVYAQQPLIHAGTKPPHRSISWRALIALTARALRLNDAPCGCAVGRFRDGLVQRLDSSTSRHCRGRRIRNSPRAITGRRGRTLVARNAP